MELGEIHLVNRGMDWPRYIIKNNTYQLDLR